MTSKKIPKPVTDILKTFFKFEKDELEYNLLANMLDMKVNTIIQRIKRYEGEFFNIDMEKRPHKISIKMPNKNVIFYRDKNQCAFCRKTVNPNNLILRLKDPNYKKKYSLKNCVTCCKDCENKGISKIMKKKSRREIKDSKRPFWEYKEIFIKKLEEYEEPEISDSQGMIVPIVGRFGFLREKVEYYEFNELDGKGWFHLTDDDGKIDSYNLKDIMNYFGMNGWELFQMYKEGDPEYTSFEEYHCFFKRRVTDEPD